MNYLKMVTTFSLILLSLLVVLPIFRASSLDREDKSDKKLSISVGQQILLDAYPSSQFYGNEIVVAPDILLRRTVSPDSRWQVVNSSADVVHNVVNIAYTNGFDKISATTVVDKYPLKGNDIGKCVEFLTKSLAEKSRNVCEMANTVRGEKIILFVSNAELFVKTV